MISSQNVAKQLVKEHLEQGILLLDIVEIVSEYIDTHGLNHLDAIETKTLVDLIVANVEYYIDNLLDYLDDELD